MRASCEGLKPGERVHVSWCVMKRRLELTWTEQGGPHVKGAPRREGFDSLFARRNINGRLNGQIRYGWNPEGLTVQLSAVAGRLNP